MNKKIKSLVLAAVMGLSLTTVTVVPTTVEAASAGAAETLIGGAVAYAYVSTAFNKMDNSKEGQEQSLARAKKQTGYLEDSAAQARVQRIMKTLEASPSVKRSYVVYANPSDDFNAFATVGRVMSVNKGALDPSCAPWPARPSVSRSARPSVSSPRKRWGPPTPVCL